MVRGLIPRGIVESWHEQVWSSMTVDRDGPAEELWNSPAGKRCVGAYTEAAKARLRLPWPDDPAQRGVDPTPFSPPVDEVPQVRAVLDQLIGPGCWGGGMEPPGGPDAEPADCLVVQHDRLRTYTAFLGAGLRLDTDGSASQFNWPSPPAKREEWAPSATAHIESYRGSQPAKRTPSGWNDQFQLGVITCPPPPLAPAAASQSLSPPRPPSLAPS